MAAPLSAGRTLVRGLVVVGAVGAAVAAVNVSRKYEQSDRRAIDWGHVRRIAVGMSGMQPALATQARAGLEQQYREWISSVEPLISDYLQIRLPRPLETVFVFDRPQWIDANIANFEVLFAPLEEAYAQLLARGGARPGALIGGVNQLVMSSQIGLLLGYLAKRVLGQYDTALLGREPVNYGKLYFLEQNIRATDRRLQVDPDQFRLWICLHEATHAFEFEAHPWLGAHLNGQISQHMELVTSQIGRIRIDGAAIEEAVQRIARGLLHGDHWLELFMDEEQRRIFRHLQALMSLLEGYSNHVMDHVGAQLMPDYTRIKHRFEQRHQQRSVIDQIWGKVTGLDLKMEQYSLGERFVNAIVAERGIAFMNHVWDGVDPLPDMKEIRHPDRWIARMEGRGQRALALDWS